MRVLCIGDIIGEIGCRFLNQRLKKIKQEKNIDLTIANGENSAKGNGLSKNSAEFLFASGVDVITTGNHCFRKGNSISFYEDNPYLLRPMNFPKFTPGNGYCIVDKINYKVCIANLVGTVFMEHSASPFETIKKFLDQMSCEIIIIDFHAEATSEKKALAYYVDGKVSAVFGTHTHVQTSDPIILSGGTGFISDVGMCGPIDSILGVKSDLVLKKFLSKLPVRFEEADGKCQLDGVIFDIDVKSGKTKSIERLQVREGEIFDKSIAQVL